MPSLRRTHSIQLSRLRWLSQGRRADWQADWDALLAAEGVASGGEDELMLALVVLANLDRHPWTIVDCAMMRTRCATCGCESGGGPLACAECEAAFRAICANDFEALYDGAMTGNKHALRVNCWVLRFPHRHSPAQVAARREVTPPLLTGALPTTREAQALAVRFKKMNSHVQEG
jgi:hypothetical protein